VATERALRTGKESKLTALITYAIFRTFGEE